MSYREELAASRSRQQKVWAELEAEYESWFRDIGTRTDLHLGARNANSGRILDYGPKCRLAGEPDGVTCEGAAHARGLCRHHYYAWYHSRARLPATVRSKNRRPLCGHAKHHARGLCKACYQSLYRDADPIVSQRERLNRLPPKQRRRRKAWACEHTDRPHRGRGLCSRCYDRHWERGTLQQFPLPTKRTRLRQPLCEHKGRPIFRRGLCQSCYQLRYRRVTGKVRRDRAYWQPGMPLLCGHQDRPHLHSGRCAPCYWAWTYDRRKRREGTGSRRPHYAHCHVSRPCVARSGWCRECYEAGKRGPVPAQCHPDRPARFRGLCVNCYPLSVRHYRWILAGRPPVHPKGGQRAIYPTWVDPRDWSEAPAHRNRRSVA